MVFHWCLRDSMSHQVSRTLLSILAVLSNAVIWRVLPVRQLPSPPGLLIILLLLCQSTNHNCYNRHFHVPQLFQFSSKVEVLILLFTFFQFYSVVSRNSKVDNFANSLFLLLIIIRSGLLAEFRWSMSMSKSHRSLCVSFFQDRCWVVHIPFVGMFKFKFLAHFPVDHLADPVVSSLVLFLC